MKQLRICEKKTLTYLFPVQSYLRKKRRETQFKKPVVLENIGVKYKRKE